MSAMQSRCVAASVVCVAGVAGSVFAQPYFGAETSVVQADRLTNGGYTNGPAGVFTGGEGLVFSSALLDGSEPDVNGSGAWFRGLSESQAALSGAVSNPTAPTLRAQSILSGNFSNVGDGFSVPMAGWCGAQAGALEAYQFTGAAATTLTLTYTLHVNYHEMGAVSTSLNGVYLVVGVVENVGFYDTFLGNIVGEGPGNYMSSGGNDAHGTLEVIGDSGGWTTLTLSLPFDVTPGQHFSIASRLYAGAVGGTTFADAFSTATGTFDHPEWVTSLSIPTPGAAVLLGFGLMAGRRRR